MSWFKSDKRKSDQRNLAHTFKVIFPDFFAMAKNRKNYLQVSNLCDNIPSYSLTKSISQKVI